jgi:hypothetical protein
MIAEVLITELQQYVPRGEGKKRYQEGGEEETLLRKGRDGVKVGAKQCLWIAMISVVYVPALLSAFSLLL